MNKKMKILTIMSISKNSKSAKAKKFVLSETIGIMILHLPGVVIIMFLITNNKRYSEKETTINISGAIIMRIT